MDYSAGYGAYSHRRRIAVDAHAHLADAHDGQVEPLDHPLGATHRDGQLRDARRAIEVQVGGGTGGIGVRSPSSRTAAPTPVSRGSTSTSRSSNRPCSAAQVPATSAHRMNGT
jgi:hypothetical protein